MYVISEFPGFVTLCTACTETFHMSGAMVVFRDVQSSGCLFDLYYLSIALSIARPTCGHVSEVRTLEAQLQQARLEAAAVAQAALLPAAGPAHNLPGALWLDSGRA